MMSSLYSVSEKVILKTNAVEQIIPHDVGYITTVVNRQSQISLLWDLCFQVGYNVRTLILIAAIFLSLFREPCLEENIIKH